MNSKSATRLFYRPFSYIFFRNFGIKLLVLYCRECHFKNKLVLSLPKFFLQLVFKIHFKTFTNIPHSQWFIDILGTSICPLRTADQLERMTLETRALATRNKQSINFQYDIICQTKRLVLLLLHQARSIKEKEPSLSADCCFSELAQYKSN